MAGSERDVNTPVAPLLVTLEAFEALEPEWAELHRRVPSAPPFAHPRWHATWLRHFGEGANPVFLSFRAGEELVGAWALDLARDAARTLGDHNVCDYAVPLAAPGYEEAIASALLEWLREDMTLRAELWGLPERSPLRRALAKAADAWGWTLLEEQEAIAPVAELPGDWESFVASLSKHDRHELRRKLRKLEGAGQVHYDLLGGDDVPRQIDDLFRLMRASRADKAAFLTPTMEAFFRDLAAGFGELGLARIGRLELDGSLTAMIFGFQSTEAFYLYNSGYDPAYAGLAVGLLSKALAIRRAIEDGLTCFDFLRGEEDYKRHLGGEPRPVYRVSLAAKPGTFT